MAKKGQIGHKKSTQYGSDNIVRLNVKLTKELNERVTIIADHAALSKSAVVTMILSAGISQVETIMFPEKVMQATLAKMVREQELVVSEDGKTVSSGDK